MRTLVPYIQLARPRQWVKNLFLFAPLIFSRHLFEGSYFYTATLAFGAFCLLSSLVYVINDIADRESDRSHPLKKDRPLASGVVGIPSAVAFAVVLFAFVIVGALELNPLFGMAGALYFILNLLYSFRLKQYIIVDVFVIAAGFMLRVLAGAYAIEVSVSHWLVLCTLFVSIFLAVSKRRGELLLLESTDDLSVRPVLRQYDLGFIDQILTVAAAGMAISYALYTVAERTVRIFGTENLIFTTVFVLFGIFRYLYLMKSRQTEENPMYILLRDGVMIANISAWFLCCVLIIYYNDILAWINP